MRTLSLKTLTVTTMLTCLISFVAGWYISNSFNNSNIEESIEVLVVDDVVSVQQTRNVVTVEEEEIGTENWLQSLATKINNRTVSSRDLIVFERNLNRSNVWYEDLKKLKEMVSNNNLERLEPLIAKKILNEPEGIQIEMFRTLLPNSRYSLTREVMQYESFKRNNQILMMLDQLRELANDEYNTLSFKWINNRLKKENLNEYEERILVGIYIGIQEDVGGFNNLTYDKNIQPIMWESIKDDVEWERNNVGIIGGRNWDMLKEELKNAESWRDIKRVIRLMGRHHRGAFIREQGIDVYSFMYSSELMDIKNKILEQS